MESIKSQQDITIQCNAEKSAYDTEFKNDILSYLELNDVEFLKNLSNNPKNSVKDFVNLINKIYQKEYSIIFFINNIYQGHSFTDMINQTDEKIIQILPIIKMFNYINKIMSNISNQIERYDFSQLTQISDVLFQACLYNKENQIVMVENIKKTEYNMQLKSLFIQTKENNEDFDNSKFITLMNNIKNLLPLSVKQINKDK